MEEAHVICGRAEFSNFGDATCGRWVHTEASMCLQAVQIVGLSLDVICFDV